MRTARPEVELVHELAELLVADRSPRDHLEGAPPRVIAMLHFAQLVSGCRPARPRPLFVLAFKHSIPSTSTANVDRLLSLSRESRDSISPN